MLAFFSMVGTVFAELRKLPPVIRWGAAVLVGLLAVEVVAKEGISIYRGLLEIGQQRPATEVANTRARPAMLDTPPINEVPAAAETALQRLNRIEAGQKTACEQGNQAACEWVKARSPAPAN